MTMQPVLIFSDSNLYQTVRNDPSWVVEPKLDGKRCVYRDGVAWSRHGIKLKNVPSLPVKEHILDGEWMEHEKKFYAFDILGINKPLKVRRKMLQKIAEENEEIKLVPQYSSNKKKWIEQFREDDHEGVVFKKVDSQYVEGNSSFWLKVRFKKH